MPGTPAPPARSFLGLDLGQRQDYSALVIAEQHGQPRQAAYHVRHLERFPLGIPYPAVVARVHALQHTPELRGRSHLVVDRTGVGAPVVDLLRLARLSPVAVTITGGDAVTREGYHHYHVPKRDLVSTLQVLLQGGRLKVAQGLPAAQLLVEELLHFQVKITVAAHDTYGAWREGAHDDLVLAVALACWYAEHQVVPRVRSVL
jgi:hypothetical protein